LVVGIVLGVWGLGIGGLVMRVSLMEGLWLKGFEGNLSSDVIFEGVEDKYVLDPGWMGASDDSQVI
jgi:hypothetical protein